MSICRCCGQPIPSDIGASPALDADVRGMMARAHVLAERHGHAEVTIAHVVLAITQSPAALGALSMRRIDRTALADAATRVLPPPSATRDVGSAQTGAEARQLLAHAERRARTTGRTAARLDDVVEVLDQTNELGAVEWFARTRDTRPMRDLPPRHAAEERTRATRAVEATGWARRETGDARTTRYERTPADASHGTPASGWHQAHGTRSVMNAERSEPAARRTTTIEADTLAAILDRLDRQERLIADLTARTGHRSTLTRWRRTRSLKKSKSNRARGRATTVSSSRSMRRRRERDERDPRPALQTLAALAPRLHETDEWRDTEPEIDDDPRPLGERPKKFYLALDDDIVRAPSIGPRTAERLSEIGILRVVDLLAHDARTIAARIDSRHVTAQRVGDWQAQARLVCTVPWLRGTHAQLLVGAGYRDLGSLEGVDAATLNAAILRFANTREGASVLRTGPPPGEAKVARWLEHTTLAEPQRAGRVN